MYRDQALNFINVITLFLNLHSAGEFLELTVYKIQDHY